MSLFVRRSLLVQLLSVYLLFVMVVLLGGVGVNAVIEQRLRNDVQASDQALAQEIAVETGLHLSSAENAITELGNAVQSSTPAEIVNIFQGFKAARSDVDYVYWLDPVGDLSISLPPSQPGLGSAFSPPGVIQHALRVSGPVFEVGIAVEPTAIRAGVIVAKSVYTGGKVIGIVAASFSLDELSNPLQNVVRAPQQQG